MGAPTPTETGSAVIGRRWSSRSAASDGGGRTIIVVGGTGLYLQALLYGLVVPDDRGMVLRLRREADNVPSAELYDARRCDLVCRTASDRP